MQIVNCKRVFLCSDKKKSINNFILSNWCDKLHFLYGIINHFNLLVNQFIIFSLSDPII